MIQQWLEVIYPILVIHYFAIFHLKCHNGGLSSVTGDKNLKEPEHGWCNYLATPLKAKFNDIYGDLQWLQYSRWMQLGFPLDSRQDKKYSLMNSINCTQPRSIGPSSAQSPSLSVMLPAGESRTHSSKDGEGKTSILHS